MATWFDLPKEVKQIIFSYCSTVDSITYVPRDRRRKKDTVWDKAHHFHDILLVSKAFITPNDFAFSILQNAKLTFDSYNELKRLVAEVSPAFKECVTCIHFRRNLRNVHWNFTDSFDGFCNIADVLSTNFPNLRQIYVSMPQYCALIGSYEPSTSTQLTPHTVEKMLRKAFIGEEWGQEDLMFSEPPKVRLPYVAASFMGNRSTRTRTGSGWNAWTRPQAWLRRLLVYAEEANIEVKFQTMLCISSTAIPNTDLRKLLGDNSIERGCWTVQNREPHYYYSNKVWPLHIKAEISLEDKVLRAEWNGETFVCRQKLIKEMVYVAGGGKGTVGWLLLLRDLACTACPPICSF